jgi:hypothetical protein
MGGKGSGRRYDGSTRMTVEKAHRIDVRYMRKHKLLKDGYCGTWSWTRNGQPNGTINFTCHSDYLTLRYSFRRYEEDQWQSIEQHISFEYTTCRYGGCRAWFTCSCCNRRCEVLCLVDRLFLCRRCCRLPYQSQLEDSLGRMIDSRNKLKMLLWGENRRRMTTLKRDRLYQKYEEITHQSNEIILIRTGQYLL